MIRRQARPFVVLTALLGLAALLATAVPQASAQATEAAPAPAAPAAPPVEDDAPMELESYQLVLLKRPEHPAELGEERLEEIQRQHLAHLTRLAAEGKIVIAGPFGDQPDERLRGLALYRVGSVEEARRLAAEDPAVLAGRLEVEAMTWYVGKGYMSFPKAPPIEPATPSPAP